MKQPVITISREFGSGGRMIGEALAKRLGFALYDKTLISMVAEKSGYSADYVEENDQRITRSVLFQIAVTGSLPPWMSVDGETAGAVAGKSVFSAQAEVIRELAQKGGCVIIGRCADHILRGDPNCLSVFVCGEKDDRLNRCVKAYGLPAAAASSELALRDRERAEHYGHHTGKVWGKAENYDLCLNSSAFGIDGCVEMIAAAAKAMPENPNEK